MKKIKNRIKKNLLVLLLWNKYRTIKGNIILKRYSDKEHIEKLYKNQTGRNINWKDPKRFSEKLQWLKLFFRDARMPILSDKIEVKKYLEQNGYGYLLNETYGVYENVNDIDLERLPDKFVIKGAAGSGWNLVCKDKNELNWFFWRKIINSWLKQDLYVYGREWNYRNLKKRIIVERYLEDASGELRDYKFFAFNGKVKFVRVDIGRYSEHFQNYYDLDWNMLNFRTNYPNYTDKIIEKPEDFEDMVKLANELAMNFPHVRVDFYNVNGKIYFGELTFFVASGFLSFHPDEYDYICGDLLQLPKANFNLDLLKEIGEEID